MSLQPENEDARVHCGVLKTMQGDARRAIAILEPALASHPNPPNWYHLSLGHAPFISGQYEAAEKALNKCLKLAVKSPYCLRYKIALYGETGRTVDAEAAAQDYASAGLESSVGAIMKLMKANDPDNRELLRKAFQSAGLPK